MVVEAVEVVGDADRVRRERVRAAPLRRLGDDSRELGQPLDQLPLLGASAPEGSGEAAASPAFRRMPAIRACAYWT